MPAMITMNKDTKHLFKRAVLLMCLTLSFGTVLSQEKDFGIWYEIGAEKKIVKNLEISLATAMRTFSHASKIEEYFIECGLDYKLNKYLSLSGYYRLINNIEEDEKYYVRHRWFSDFKGSVDVGRFDLSGRFRLQERYKTYFEDKEDKIPDMHARFRLKAIYKTPDFPVNPYTSLEFYYPLNKYAKRDVDKKWFIAGIEYKISGKHVIEIEYMRQRDYRPKLSDDDIVSFNYIFKF